MVPIFSQNLKNCNFGRGFHGNEKKYEKNEMHFQYTVFGPLDEFHGFIQICYYECPHISGIYLESLLIHQIKECNAYYVKQCFSKQYTFKRMDKSVSYVTKVLNKLQMRKTIRK